MTIPRCTKQSFLIVLEWLTSLTNTLTEIGHGHLLDRIFFESMTTLDVECYFKGMRADHDLPTVAHYVYRRAAHLSEGFLIFYWTQFILSGENYQRWTPKHQDATTQQSAITEGRNSSGSKEEDTMRETVMREFAEEYGRGVRQENVRSKTKELTGTLPYALSMCPTTSQPR